jgi:hypothetical protein
LFAEGPEQGGREHAIPDTSERDDQNLHGFRKVLVQRLVSKQNFFVCSKDQRSGANHLNRRRRE